MLNQEMNRRSNLNRPVFHLVAAGGIGLILGIASIQFSPLLVLGVLIAAFLMVGLLYRPELGLLGILITTSTIVFEDRLPLIPIPAGSLHIPDVFLLTLLGLVVVRWLLDPQFKLKGTPLDLPLFIFYGMAFLSTIIAIALSTLDFNEGLRELRVVTYFLTFFAVTNLVREDRQIRLLREGLFFLATVVAVTMIAQFALGESFSILPGRVETLKTQDTAYADVTRILPPGQSLVLVTTITLITLLVFQSFKYASIGRFIQLGLVGLGVILTFNRSFWVGVIISLLLLASLTTRQVKRRLIILGLATGLLLVIIIPPFFSVPDSPVARLSTAFVDRLATITGVETVLEDESFRWRDAEYEYALPQISSHVFLGMGMGTHYRPWDSRMDWKSATGEFDGRGYIHNGHIWIMLKAGFIGYLGLAWLSLAFLFRGLKHWRHISDPQSKGTVLGFTLVYLAVLIGTVVSPMFVQWYWTPVIGIMMGVNEVLISKSRTHGDIKGESGS